MDIVLHAERTRRDRSKVTYQAAPSELPDGTMVRQPGENDKAALLWEGKLVHWSPGGYLDTRPLPDQSLEVLTPRSSVAVLRAGYRPLLHSSADLLG